MANFFKKGKKLILSVAKGELQHGGSKLLAVLKEALPLTSGSEILQNLSACETVSVEAVSILASFARESRKAGCHLKVTASLPLQDQFAVTGLDRHFILQRPGQR